MPILSQKIIKIRKECRCFGCRRKLYPGTNVQRTVQVLCGEFFETRLCEACQVYSINYVDYGEEYAEGELKDNDAEGWEEIRKKVEGF